MYFYISKITILSTFAPPKLQRCRYLLKENHAATIGQKLHCKWVFLPNFIVSNLGMFTVLSESLFFNHDFGFKGVMIYKQ